MLKKNASQGWDGHKPATSAVLLDVITTAATGSAKVTRADRVLLHPWTTRVGAIQAIIGAGLLAAAIVGGAVTLVFRFPRTSAEVGMLVLVDLEGDINDVANKQWLLL